MQKASKEAYAQAGITNPVKELDVAELYIPCAWGGLKWIEDIGFCDRGQGAKFVRERNTHMDGIIPVNPSGGVLSTNCIGATALLRVAEAAIQVMGKGDKRQVPDVKNAIATGFGGCFWSDVVILSSEKP